MKLTKYLTVAAALFVLGWTSACGTKTETKNTNANQPAANSASNTTPAPANKTAESPAANSSTASPTEVYKTAYAAREKKDIEGLKKIFAKDVTEFMTKMAKEENKTLDDSLKEMCETPQAKTAEARNEKIDGDRATIEYLDEKGNWSTMYFVKEDGAWKLTMPKATKETEDLKSTEKKPDDKKPDDKKQQ